jgi:hypothetical protein
MPVAAESAHIAAGYRRAEDLLVATSEDEGNDGALTQNPPEGSKKRDMELELPEGVTSK